MRVMLKPCLFLLVLYLSVNSVVAKSNAPCTHCPIVETVKDASLFDANIYYRDSYRALSAEPHRLKHAIHKDINREFHPLKYKEVWSVLTYSDEEPNNRENIRLIYKNTSISKQHNGTGKFSRNQDYWNREHIWPKSHGFPKRSQQGYTDVHHIKPADVSLNTQRSDNDFFNGGMPIKEAPWNKKYKSQSFEPHNGVKGDIARMIFYMDVMYENGSHHDMPDLQVVTHHDTARSKIEDGVGQIGDLCTLLQWHFADPVDSFKINRNTIIYTFQANRNPFIDHPEWVTLLYEADCD